MNISEVWFLIPNKKLEMLKNYHKFKKNQHQKATTRIKYSLFKLIKFFYNCSFIMA